MPGAEERVYFEDANVKVTNARIVAFGTTYAMAAVNSVQAISEADNKVAAGCGTATGGGMLLAGIFLALLGKAFLAMGVGFGFLGGVLLFFFLPALRKGGHTYTVALTTSSGQIQAMSSRDWPTISRIVEAINMALVGRG